MNVNGRLNQFEKAVIKVMDHMRDKKAGVLQLGLKDNDESRQALKELFDLVETKPQKWVCVVEGEDDPFETCVWDGGHIDDCSLACAGTKKENCQYWKLI